MYFIKYLINKNKTSLLPLKKKIHKTFQIFEIAIILFILL